VVGFPIRISPDRRLYTAPRGFSQCPTSFFGTWRLGILRKPLLAYLHHAEISLLLAPSRYFFIHYSVGKVLIGGAARQPIADPMGYHRASLL
jgi:hypothetical protein